MARAPSILSGTRTLCSISSCDLYEAFLNAAKNDHQIVALMSCWIYEKRIGGVHGQLVYDEPG